MFNVFKDYMLITSYSIFIFLLILLNYTILSQLPKDICCILQLKIIFANILRQRRYICQYFPFEPYLPCPEIPVQLINATVNTGGGICRSTLLAIIIKMSPEFF